MKLGDVPGALRDLLLGMLPHRTRTGLEKIGQPGRNAPVLVTGNYALTVRRLRRSLAGQDVWLLCANSKGINVWCAAGGGHLTHHDVIGVVRTSGIEERVDHRELVLPQLCATGVERRKVAEATGWKTRWGPARLEDLPSFLARGRRVHKGERFMRFPLWERLEMAILWGFPMLLIATPLIAWLVDWHEAIAALACITVLVSGPFAAVPWLPPVGGSRWISLGSFAALGVLAGVGVLAATGALSTGHVVILASLGLALVGVLSVDIAGTTPWFGSTINTRNNPATIDLVEDRCTGAAECVQVCPRDVLKMNVGRRKVEIARPDQCIQCGACIVQCPEDALRFRYASGEVAEATLIRRTRLNMVGRRTVHVRE